MVAYRDLGRWLRVARVVINSIGFVLLLGVGLALWSSNPLLSALFFLAAFDQLEDVYAYTTGRRLVPRWLAPLDVFLEAVLFCFALAMLLLAVFYYAFFATWFWRLVMALSVLIMWSAVEDCIDILRPPTPAPQPTASLPTTTHAVFVVRRDAVRKKAFVERRK